jgi:hypothetical protein
MITACIPAKIRISTSQIKVRRTSISIQANPIMLFLSYDSVVWKVATNVTEEHTTSIFRVACTVS